MLLTQLRHTKSVTPSKNNGQCVLDTNTCGVRPRLYWNQNRHNTTVWTDFRQGRRYQTRYSLYQRLHSGRSDRSVISRQRPTVWRQQSGYVSSRQSGQIRAAVCVRFECGCSGLIASIRFNLQEPCVLYIGRAHRYPPNTPFYIFFQQIYALNFLNRLQTLRFFLFKMPFIS